MGNKVQPQKKPANSRVGENKEEDVQTRVGEHSDQSAGRSRSQNSSKQENEDKFIDALIKNKPDEVKDLLGRSFDLEAFLTWDQLENLYSATEHQMFLKRKRFSEKKGLESIGERMAKTIGEGYAPPYQLDDYEDGTSLRYEMKKLENEPWRDLFLWSVIVNKYELAKLFMEKGEQDMMAGCLVATKLLKISAARAMKKKQKEAAKSMEQNCASFAAKAVELQNQEYLSDVDKAKIDLLRRLEGYGGTNALELAAASSHKAFLSQTCVQVLLQSRWMGHLDDQTTTWKLCLAWFFAPFIPCLLNFTYDKEAFSESIPTSNTNLQGQTSKVEEKASYFQKVMWFYRCPAVIFANNLLSFITFLLLYSYVILCDFQPWRNISSVEITVMVWVGTLLLEEIRQVENENARGALYKVKAYFQARINFLDATPILVFLTLGTSLRFLLPDEYLFWARFVYAVNFVMFSVRLLHFFSFSHHLGPTLVMIYKMMSDLFYFVLILFVFVGAFGVAQHAILFPNSQLDGRMLWELLRRPYWQMFGELFLDEIFQWEKDGQCTNNPALYLNYTVQRCPSEEGIWIDPIFLGLYLLMTQVLMLNLLIAIFSDTYSLVRAAIDEHWSFQRYRLIQEYCERPTLVPPLIFFSHAIHVAQVVVRGIGKQSCNKGKPPATRPPTRASVISRRERRGDPNKTEEEKPKCLGMCNHLTPYGFRLLNLEGRKHKHFIKWSAEQGRNFIKTEGLNLMKDPNEQLKTQVGGVSQRLVRMESFGQRLEKIEKQLGDNETVQKELEELKTTQTQMLATQQDVRATQQKIVVLLTQIKRERVKV